MDTLRDLVNSHEIMCDYLKHQHKQYRTKSKDIYKRFRAQLNICESILSEYTAAESYLHLIEEQETKVRQDLDKLHSLFRVHPIHQLPSEVLQHIFQFVVDSMDDRTTESFRAATSLSHVCQSWRSVTLQMPAFWNRMSIPMQCKPDALKKYFSRTAARIGDLGARISFRGATGHEDEALVLFSCRLDWLPKIEYLEILPASHAGLEFTVKAISFLPKVDIEHIFLSLSEARSGGGVDGSKGKDKKTKTKINISPLLQNFPGLQSFSMDGVDYPIWSDPDIIDQSKNEGRHAVFLGVEHVAIAGAEELSIQALARSFPEASTLSLMSISHLTDDTNGPETDTPMFPHLEDIVIEDLCSSKMTPTPFHRRDASNDDDPATHHELDALVDLIASARSLQNLYIQNSPELLLELDDKASMIESLTTNHPEILAKISLGRMQHLQYITMHHNDRLSDVVLEGIVKGHRMRKLPTPPRPASAAITHSSSASTSTSIYGPIPIPTPTSRSDSPSDTNENAHRPISLRILVPNQVAEADLSWSKAEICSIATKEGFLEERGGEIYRNYILTWP